MANKESTLLIKIKEVGAETLGKLKTGFEEIAAKAAAVSAVITGALGLSVKAFSDSEEATKKLNQAIRNQGLDVDSLSKRYGVLAEAIMKKTTFDDDEIKSALAVGQALAGNVALTDDLIKATIDFAAAKKMDLASAFELVGKSIGTEKNALSKYGVELGKGASASEKMAKITKALSHDFEGQAEILAMGANGAVKQMTNAIGELAEAVGEHLAPFVESAARGLTDLINAAAENKTLVKVGTVVAAVTAALTGLAGAIGAVVAAWPVLAAGFAALTGPVGIAIAAVVALGTAVALNFDEIQKIAFGVFGAVKTFIANAFDNLTKVVNSWMDVLQGAFSLDFDATKSALEKFKDTLVNVGRETVEAYKIGYKEREQILEKSLEKHAKAEKRSTDETVAYKKSKIEDLARVEIDKKKDIESKKRKSDEETAERAMDVAVEYWKSQEGWREHLAKVAKEKEEEEAKRKKEAQKVEQEDRERSIKQTADLLEKSLSGGFQGAASFGVSALTETFLPGFGGVASQAFDLLSQDSEKFSESMTKIFSTDFVDNIAENIPVLIEHFQKNMPKIVEHLIEAIIENAPRLAVAMAGIWYKPEFYKAMALGIANGFANGVRDALKNSHQMFVDGLGAVLQDAWASALPSIQQGLTSAYEFASQLTYANIRQGFIDGSRALLVEFPAKLSNFAFVELPEGLRNGAQAFLEAVSGFFTSLPEMISSASETFRKILTEELPAAIKSAFSEAAIEMKGAVLAIRDDLVNGIKQGVGDAVGVFKQSLGDFVGGFKESLGGIIDPIQRAFASFKEEPAWVRGLREFLENFKIEVPGSGGGGGGGGIVGKGKRELEKRGIKFSRGGPVYAAGGKLIDFVPRGTDTVPAMLTPGEYVVNAGAASRNMGLLNHINSGGSGMAPVININVYGGMLGDQATASQFARAVDTELNKLRRQNQSVAFDKASF